MTHFVHVRVPVAPGLSVVIDGNSKITASNGTFEHPAPNAFSLPSAAVSMPEHCPGSTPTCRRTCYTHGLFQHAPDVYAAYAENARALSWILDRASRAETAAARLGRWIAEHARGGFRWHVSGDVRGTVHAQWIADVCRASPDVSHWIYTRTFDAVPALLQARNLAVNVSADVDNYAEALRVARMFSVRVCYEATGDGAVPKDLPHGSVVFPDYPLRGRDLADPTAHPWWQSLPHARRLQVCPADQFGQSESARCGPCAKCMIPRS